MQIIRNHLRVVNHLSTLHKLNESALHSHPDNPIVAQPVKFPTLGGILSYIAMFIAI
jgi:hypothetical protein